MPKHSKKRPSHRRRRSSFLQSGWKIFAAVLVILLITAVAIYFNRQGSQASASAPHEITAQEAYQKYQAGAFFLDVREQSEWNTAHIPRSVLIPLGELPNRLDELPRDQEIVVVCRSGHRSQEGRDILLQAGFTTVNCMAGGVTKWSALGYPVEGTRP